MKTNLLNLAVFGLFLLMLSCGEKKESPLANEAPEASNPYKLVSGSYEDTLPCADCKGILTRLVLSSDSVFTIRERHLGAAAPSGANSAGSGRFVLENDGQRVKLEFRNGTEIRYFARTEESLTLLDPQGNPLSAQGDYTLEKLDRLVESASGFNVRYLISGSGDNRSSVYMKTPKGDITIDKPFLSGADEATKAVVAFYTLRFDAGCGNGSCALAEALELDEPAMKKLVKTWFGDGEKVTSALLTDSVRPPLNMLFLNRNSGRIEVTCVVQSDSDRPKRYTEIYSLENNQFVWTSQTDNAATDRTVVERNTERSSEFPQGGKQVIDMKKVRESGQVKTIEKH